MKTTLKQIGILLLFSGVVSFLANCVHPQGIPWVRSWSNHIEAKARSARISVIPLTAAREKHQTAEVVFIDARSAASYQSGHISGAVSVPSESFAAQLSMLEGLIDSGKELVIYCGSRTCDDALLLAMKLQAIGAKRVTLYIDGFDVWQEFGP